MDEKVKKPLPVSTAIKKKLPPSFLANVQLVSLWAVLLLTCCYAGFAAYNLTNHNSSCHRAAGCRGGAGAAVLAGRRRRRSRQALAFVALAATAASHSMYGRILGLIGADAPGNQYVAVETAAIFVAAALDLLGFLALLLE